MAESFDDALKAYMESRVNDEPGGKRQDIVTAALELFSQKGYSATTTASIAKTAGVSEKTLFKYYPTKKELFMRVYYDAAVNLTGTRYMNLVHSDGDLRENMLKLYKTKFDETMKDSKLFKLMIQEILVDDELRKSVIESLRNFWENGMGESMKDIANMAANPRLDVVSVTIAIVGLLTFYVLTRAAILPGDGWADEKNLENLVDILCYGLLGTPPTAN